MVSMAEILFLYFEKQKVKLSILLISHKIENKKKILLISLLKQISSSYGKLHLFEIPETNSSLAKYLADIKQFFWQQL